MRGEVRFLQFFRALAALWVLTAHCQIWGGASLVPLRDPKFAVDLFMLISGYLMADTSARRWASEPMTDPRARARFWVRRLARLTPALYATIAFSLIASPWVVEGLRHLQGLNREMFPADSQYGVDLYQFTWSSVLAHVSYMSGLIPWMTNSLPLPDWSLSLEMQFYLAFPCLALCFRKWPSPWVAAAIAWGIFTVGSIYSQRVYFPEPSMLALKVQYFVAGMLLQRALQIGRTTSTRVVSALAGAWLCGIEARFGSDATLVVKLYTVMAAVGLLEATGSLPGWGLRVLSSRLVRFYSDISYSLYLVHGCLIGLAGLLLSRLGIGEANGSVRTVAIFCLTLTVGTTVAWAMRRWIELPGIMLGNRLMGTDARASVGTPSAKGAMEGSR